MLSEKCGVLAQKFDFELVGENTGLSRNMRQRPLPRNPPCTHRSRQQIPARRRLPIQHLTCAEHAGELAQHVLRCHGFEADAACGADGFVYGAWGAYGDG
jgi:hypothetical protein